MSKAHIISNFLIMLSQQVQSLSEEELDELLKEATLGRLLRQRPKAPSKRRVIVANVRSRAEALMEELSTKSSRKEAVEFLDALSPSKDVLTAASRMREVHIVKQDTLKTISEKLVENVVGSRLDSARIRGAK